MHLTKSYVIVNIQPGNPSYGQMTLGNIDYIKHPSGYGDDWRQANELESDLYKAGLKNMQLAFKHI